MNLKSIAQCFSILLVALLSSTQSQAAYTGLSSELVLENSIPGFSTYRIYANFDDPADQLISLIGFEGAGIFFSTDGEFHQELAFGGLATNVNPIFFPIDPDLEYDSWITIGGEDNSLVGLNAIGLDFTEFESGNDLIIDTDPGGGLFVVPGSVPESFPDAQGRVLLAQLTVNGDIDIQLNVQWRDANGVSSTSLAETLQQEVSEPSAYEGLSFELVAEDAISGSDTYRIYANISSPEAQVVSVTGQNLDILELTSTGAFYQNVVGGPVSSDISSAAITIDPNVIYDSWVTIGTEQGPNGLISIGTDFTNFEAGGDILNDDLFGGGWFIVPDSEPLAYPDAQGRVLLAQVTTDGVVTFSANIQDIVSDGTSYVTYDSITFPDVLSGCTDSNACNYSTEATEDDGSCVNPTGCETCTGETDGSGTVVSNDTDGDGVCDGDEVEGCQDDTACNYNSAATDAGACILSEGCETCTGETDGSGTVVSNDADGDGVCDGDEVVGCQNSAACNYNTAATDSGPCIFAAGVCDTCSGANDGTGFVVDNDADNDGVCDGDEIDGCTDQEACNFDTEATEEDGSCIFVFDDCGNCGGNDTSGCTDSTALNYDSEANCDDNSCIYAGGGCTYDFALNFDPLATFDDGSCIERVDGCTDSEALNYNASANNDDGSCAFPIPGCTDCSALNYNEDATFDDESCNYLVTCEGDFNNDGLITSTDLLTFLSIFGLACPE